ncbi:GLUG motif-containing protein [Viscerimonas tarda]
MRKSILFLMALILLSGHYAKAQFSGEGSDSEPFIISNATELATLATNVNDGTNYSGAHFSLIADIDLSGVSNWIPIGGGSNAFKGVFHGDYHTISNVTASGTTDVGLFGYISEATVENLFLVNVNISGTGARKGGIIGNAAAGSVVRNCYVSGNVSGAGNNGGLIGESYAIVSNCYAAVNVSGDDTQGGLIGYHRNGASITNSYSTGNVVGKNHVGGVAGYARNGGSITYSYSTGAVSGTGSASNGVGGVVGTVRDAAWTIQNNAAINPSIVSTNAAAANRILGVNNGATGLILSSNYALAAMLVNSATVTGSITDNNGGDKEAGDFRVISTFNTSGNWSGNAWDIDAIANNGKTWNIWEGKSYPYLQIQSAPIAVETTPQANGIVYELRNNTEKVVVTAENGTVLKTETSVTAGNKTIGIQGLANNTPIIVTVHEVGKMPSYPVKTVYVSGETNIININSKAGTGKLNLYPGLVEESLTVTYSNELAPNSIEIYDSTGRLSGTYTANSDKTTLNLSSLASGYYILKAGNSVAKFMKK